MFTLLAKYKPVEGLIMESWPHAKVFFVEFRIDLERERERAESFGENNI